MTTKIIKKHFCENCLKIICLVGEPFPTNTVRKLSYVIDGKEIYKTFCNSKCEKEKKKRDLEIRRKLSKYFAF